MIHFLTITHRQLPSFTESELFSGLSEIPVTDHRANSLTSNPRASADDPALILAFDENEKVIGYWGFLSDYLNGNPNEKVLWNSGWRVLPDSSHAAMPLLYKALQICGNGMLFSDLTPHTKHILEATGKITVVTRKGIRWYIKPCSADIIPARKPSLKFIKPLLKFADFVTGLFKRKSKIILPPDIKIIKCESLDKTDQEFINSVNIHSLSNRGINEINWIKNKPWIIPINQDKTENRKRYYFTSSENIFSTHLYRIFKDEKFIALAMLNNRNGHFTIPYFICLHDSEKDSAFAIQSIVSNAQAKSFTTFNPLLLSSEFNIPCFYKKPVERYFAYTNKLHTSISDTMLIQDGDGDCAFT